LRGEDDYLITQDTLAKLIETPPSGVSPGPTGLRNEHMKEAATAGLTLSRFVPYRSNGCHCRPWSPIGVIWITLSRFRILTVVPSGREDIFRGMVRWIHEHDHVGYKDTFRAIRRRFWWNSLASMHKLVK
jgi:hypothetical protein